MSAELITKAAEGLAKQVLPVKEAYDDAVSPAAKQVGNLLSDLTKTIMLVLAPVQLAGAYQDRLRDFLDKSVRKVPEKDRVSPPPQILGPVLEGIRYEPEDTPIDEMFSELLSRSMHKDQLGAAHPSYPYLIKQLSADEARILSLLKNATYARVRTLDIKTDAKGEFENYDNIQVEFQEFPLDALDFPENLSFYINHLQSIGLADCFESRIPEPIADLKTKKQIGIREFTEYRLTNLGRHFADACIPEQTEAGETQA